MFDILVAGLITVLCALTVFFILIPYQWIPFRTQKMLKNIPGIPGVPIFGNMLIFFKPPEDFLSTVLSMCQKYGPTIKIYGLGIYEVIVTDLEDIELIMSSSHHITKASDYDLLLPWLATGLLTSTGGKWHGRRKTLTPAFHLKILEQYIEVFNSNSNILVADLEKHAGEPSVEITKLVTLCTLDMICEAIMGTSVNAQKDGEFEYVKAVKRMGELFNIRQLSCWLWRPCIFSLSSLGREQKKVLATLHGFTDKVIKERRLEYQLSANNPDKEDKEYLGKRRLAFLDLLIEISEKEGLLTDADIREEVDTFMFEGHETTSVAICWALFLLGHNQDVQDKVVNEQNEIFGDDDRPGNYTDYQRMTYLEQVIKESLRLYPSVPMISRKVDVDVQIKNFVIPAGSNVPIIIYELHRNPKYFPDPEKFDPERFSPENLLGRHPFSYLPFSAGPRNCIGQKFAMLEEKALLSCILRKYKIESLDKREDIILLINLTLKSKNGLRLKLSYRN